MIKNYAIVLMLMVFGLVSGQETISFEASEDFELGNLNAQNGWEVTDDSEGNFLENQVVTDAEASDGTYSFKNAYEPDYNFQWLPIFGAAKNFDSPKSYEDFTFSYDVMVTDTLGADFEMTLFGINADEEFVPVAGIAMENRGMIYVIKDINYGSDYTDAEWTPNTWVNVKIEVTAEELNYYVDDVLVYTGDNYTSVDIVGFNMLHNNYGADGYYDNITFASGTLGNTDFTDMSDLRIYPNPVQDELKIKGIDLEQISQVSIYNLSGQQMMESKSVENLEVSHLSQGVYILKIDTQNNKTLTHKLIKE